MSDPVAVLVEFGVPKADAMEACKQTSFTRAASLLRFAGGQSLSLLETKALMGLAFCGRNTADWQEIGAVLMRRNSTEGKP